MTRHEPTTDPPEDTDDPGERRTIPGAVAPLYSASEKRALSILAAAAAIAMAWIAEPIAVGLFLGVLSAFTVQPLYLRLRAHVRVRFDWAALVCALVAGVALLGLAGLFFTLLVARGAAVASALPRALGHGGPLGTLTQPVVHLLTRVHVRTDDLAARLGESIGAAASRATIIAAALAGATFDGLLGLFFLLLTLHFTLVHWDALTRRVEAMLPLNPRHTHALFDEFRRVGRTVLAGTVVTGVAQGVLAGIGYAITGVPEAPLLGALTAIASLVPAVGTLVIWVPAGIYLMLMNHVGRGVVELLWGLLVVVVTSDYVIRPRLVGAGSEMPTLVTFVALFGGIEAFGIIGLVLGPVLMALALAVLRIHERESMFRRGTR